MAIVHCPSILLESGKGFRAHLYKDSGKLPFSLIQILCLYIIAPISLSLSTLWAIFVHQQIWNFGRKGGWGVDQIKSVGAFFSQKVGELGRTKVPKSST